MGSKELSRVRFSEANYFPRKINTYKWYTWIYIEIKLIHTLIMSGWLGLNPVLDHIRLFSGHTRISNRRSSLELFRNLTRQIALTDCALLITIRYCVANVRGCCWNRPRENSWGYHFLGVPSLHRHGRLFIWFRTLLHCVSGAEGAILFLLLVAIFTKHVAPARLKVLARIRLVAYCRTELHEDATLHVLPCNVKREKN